MKLDYPQIISLGVARRLTPDIAIACDVRHIDYQNTDGFQQAGFDATGAVTGFGWSSIWTVSTGAELTLTSRLKWRTGYTFNQCPIGSPQMFYNSPAPAVVQHHLSTGATYDMGSGWLCTAAYHHGFANSASGPWAHPLFGEIPGTMVRATLATHGFVLGINRRF